MGEAVQMLAVDDVAFLEKHQAHAFWSDGHKVGLEWRRPDGLLLQHSGWSIGEAINAARASLWAWEASR